MRELTSLPDTLQARRLAAYLSVQGIATTVDQEDQEWVLWIHNDDDLPRAQEILDEFLADPSHSRYENAERKVKHVLREADRLNREIQKRQIRLQDRWSGVWWLCYPATYIMIGLSCLVAFVCTDWNPPQMGSMGPVFCNRNDSELLWALNVQTPLQVGEVEGVRVAIFPPIPQFPRGGMFGPQFGQILAAKFPATLEALRVTFRSGDIWRPVTPIFIHYGLLHLLFNMMWMKTLGAGVEYVRGTWRYIVLCLLLAVISNICQLFWSGPFFGGMSGVVFGLIGYVWMKGKTQPRQGLGLTHQTFVHSVFWLLLCMTGALGPIANAAHLSGFLAGMAFGSRGALWSKWTRRISDPENNNS